MEVNTENALLDRSSPIQNDQQTPNGNESRADEVAKRFEALLLYTIMKSMRASVSSDSLTGSDQQDMYREMMDREIAESIADGGGLGLQKMLSQQLSSGQANETTESVPSELSRDADRASLGLDILTRQRLLATSSFN